MIRQALDGKIGDKKEDKDEFLREFCKLRARHEELLNQSIQARRSLKQVRLEVRLAIIMSTVLKMQYMENITVLLDMSHNVKKGLWDF